VGSIGIHLDITDQKQLEIDLIEAREQAEQSTRSKEVFLANMSHEIRTPMNAIFGMTHQLTKTKLDASQRFYLDTIHSASENLLVIINDILDLSKIEAGKMNLENIGFDPKAVINRAMQVLRHKAEEKGLNITNSTLDPALSPVLIGDPYRIKPGAPELDQQRHQVY
jgi:signal transduction histidine kinase